jgi:mono/diheme cytochrome c family protein/plastocyanin
LRGAVLLALSSSQAILLALGGVVLLIAGIGGLLYARRRPPEAPDIPPAMQPGPSDGDLEKPDLERRIGWAALLVIFFVLWIPMAWLAEPGANLASERELVDTAIERGELAIEPFSEENPGGVGCVQCHGPGLQGGQTLFQGEPYPVPALTNVCARLTLDQIKTTIEQGREGTPMPSWSIRFEGSLNDQQINELIAYIVHINQENVPFEQNLCINPEAGQEDTGGDVEGLPVVSIVAPEGASIDGFAETEVTAPAGEPFALELDNQDPNIPHNVAILPQGGGDPQASSDNVTGPGAVTFRVEVLDAGTYPFLCTLHPTTMTGNLMVEQGGGAASPESSPTDEGGS